MDTKVTILIIDDDPTLRKTLSDILSAKGYLPIDASTGKEALEIIKNKKPAVALIDLKLEDMSGLEVMKEIEGGSSFTECIVITGHASQTSAIEAIRLGAYGYIQKPYDIDQLLLTIQRAVEKINTEKTLLESEGRFSGMFEHMSSGVAVYESVDNGEDFVFKAFNPAAEGITHISQNEALENRLLDIFPNMDKSGLLGTLQRVWKTGREEHIPPFYYKDEIREGWRENRVYKLPTGEVIALFDDVTERKQAEEALRKSEEKYRSMMESMDDPVYICSPDYHVEYMNPAMVKKRGGRNAVGEPCYKVLHELDEKCPWCVHNKVQQGENRVTEIDSPRDNRTYNVSHFPVHNADGSISKLTIYRDVTEKRKMEARFQQTTKMEAIATLAGGVAHEFNNALMGIMGNIELLKMDLPEDERRDKSFEAMNESGHRMSRLTDQLLAYSEGGKYNAKNVKLDDFVIETLPILQHDLSPEVRIETHFSKVSYIRADNAQMQMVLSAILANSNEAIEDEGIIKITAENKDVDEGFTKQHPGLKPGSYVCLTIEDDGKGMDEETKDGIFEPFFTTKFQGRGMGMAAVYGIIKSHDGAITVESEPDKGTVVRIYLPAVEAKEEAKEVKQPKVEIAMGEGTILVIEDEEPLVGLFREILERLGYRALLARTGKEAVELAKTFDGQ
ncbi:MAG: response regulator, partial [Deltaproteobacteria bacterium]|nr:response regulator [Deltaproteobacteria bacterium]